MQAKTIGIAGAGIGGLAAAALLARDGHEVTVYDQFEAPAPVGSGLVIQTVGQSVLEHLDLNAPLRKKGGTIHRMLGNEAHNGRRVLDVWYDRSAQQASGLAVHRAALFQALLGAAQQAGATLLSSQRVTGVSDGPHRCLIFAGGRKSPAFDLVIDACGARSPLSPIVARDLHYGALWGTVPWPHDTTLSPTELRQTYRRASRMMGVLPIGTVPGRDGPQAAVFWSLPRAKIADWVSQPLSDWKAQACDLWPDVAPFLHTIHSHNQMTAARYAHGTLKTPVQTGMAHIGDAAHQASPQLGQGANMALLDAFALSRALRDQPTDQALATYAKARRWHVRVYQAMSWLFTPQYQSDSRLLPVLRDWGLAPVSAVPPMPRLLSHLVRGTMLPPVGRAFAQHLENKPFSAL